MIALNASFLAALQAGTGTPIFYISLYEYYSAAWNLIASFDVTKAELTRLKFTIEVHEDLIGSPNIVTTSGTPYAITVTRGLNVAGTDYTITTRRYYISEADYLANDHKTVLVADLLPAIAIRSIAADTLAGTVIDNALTSVFVDDFFVDGSRDIWYSWQFYPTTKTLNLFDARSLSSLLANKYFAYLFPRSTGLQAYNVPSNFENAEDGNYTPFAHAKARQITSSDKYLNLSWTSETGKKYLVRSAAYAYHALGFIADAVNPSAQYGFPEWSLVFTRHTFEIEQRPDLRLEQGDLIKLSYDTFDKIRCIELVEKFKRGKDARWVQIIKQLQWHPQAGAVRIGDFPDDPAPKPTASNILTITDNFNQLLSIADSTVQAALDTLDEYIELASGWRKPNETWTYVGANSFSITGDKTSIYGIGDKIKLTQTTVKYFSVYGVSFGAGVTTALITAGTDFTLANAAITDNHYSKAASPNGFPSSFNYTPTYSALAPMTYTAVTNTFSRFYIIGRMLFFNIRAIGTTGGTASREVYASLPVPWVNIGANPVIAATISDVTFGVGRGYYGINGIGFARQVAGADGNWGLGASKTIIGQGHYEI